ncbi:MAG: hypothetical protein AAF685_07910 [Cyanobacteria bacterium P01_C01_bin.89]
MSSSTQQFDRGENFRTIKIRRAGKVCFAPPGTNVAGLFSADGRSRGQYYL